MTQKEIVDASYNYADKTPFRQTLASTFQNGVFWAMAKFKKESREWLSNNYGEEIADKFIAQVDNKFNSYENGQEESRRHDTD